MRRMRAFAAFWILLCLEGSSFAETVIYDGNEIFPFKGRTAQDVTAKYLEARKLAGTYRDNDETTWYEIPASIKSPYVAGKLTDDTHSAMTAMTDFYRWLTGVKPSSKPSTHSESLQHQALDRNFEFSHIISQYSKPDDMPQDLWDLGFYCEHNILSLRSDPADAVTAWLNEGYILGRGWDEGGNRLTLGHRLAIISGYNTSIRYGYCGKVGIGYITGYGNSFEGAFAAFPAPGKNPRRKISPRESAWHVQLNRQFLTAPDEESLNITVTDLITGESYDCNRNNGKLGLASTVLIPFVQPSSYSDDKYYEHDYRVNITGLKETATGNDAAITYIVSFMEMPPEITIRSPRSMTVGNGLYMSMFINGRSPVEWELYEGKLPEGITIEKNSFGEWYLGGTPKQAGTYTFKIRAVNADGEDISSYTINVADKTPSITTESLPSASVDMKYSAWISASGNNPITFAVTEGKLPEGLTLSSSGAISGTPTEAGDFTFTVTATNTAGNDSKQYTLSVGQTKPVIKTEIIYDFEVMSGITYHTQIRAEGNKPITFTLKSGSLPDGLTLSSDGTINGIPEKAGYFTFTVRAENSTGYDEKEYTVRAVTVKPEISTNTFSTLQADKNSMIFLYANGSKPVSWSVTAGKLPDGLTLTISDIMPGYWVIQGMPSTAGKFTFTLRVENSAGYDEKEFTLEVEGEAEFLPSINTESLPDISVGVECSLTLSATGSMPITWGIMSGKLPAGLTLNSSGIISGTPTKAGKFTFTVKATNAQGSDTQRFTLQVYEPVSIITASLKDATVAKNYSVTPKAKGTKPLTWSATGLPNGLSINAKTGRISGKPTVYGTFSVKITASNEAGSTEKSLQLTVKAIAPKLSGSLAKATINSKYSSGLKLTAGSLPVTWSCTGTLPDGLTFDTETGIISGTPTSYEKSGYKLKITAMNDAGSKSKNVTLRVKAIAPKITTKKLQDATSGSTYNMTLTATGSEPITWTADGLPKGLSINGSTITGKPTKSGSYKVILYATNPVKSVKKSFSLNVKASDIRLPVFALPHMDYVVVAELGTISCDEEGMYEFDVALNDNAPEGWKLVYMAGSDKPSDDDEIAEFYDETGEEISAVPESRIITVSIWLNPGTVYVPKIAVTR